VSPGSGEFLDLASWKRREHFELFRSSAHPFFSVTVDVEVTRLRQRCLDRPDASFSLSAILALLRAANACEPFRLRLRGDAVWRHARVGVGTTVLRSDETFGFARLDLTDTEEEFYRVARPTMAQARTPTPLDPMHDNDDLVYHSTLPWLRFTSFTNALSGTDSIPRVVFGKVFADGTAYRMPMGVEVHHALVDGLDVARFIDAFTGAIEL
jgi:chloramphenicol O-acetyltransferase type A